MANADSINNTKLETANTNTQNDINQWGQAILRAKTTLIKPYSKVNQKH